MVGLAPGVVFAVEKDGVRYEFEVAEEGGYIAFVPVYPSCASQGESFEEALANVEDALLGCLAAARDLNLPIPEQLNGLTPERS